MSIELNDAVRRIFVATQTQLPRIDLWEPDGNARGGFFDRRKPPLLIGDDGNLLIALLSALKKDGDQSAKSWSKFADGIRVTGSLLHRAALDYGMHRLLLLLVVPEDNDVSESLSAELSNARYTAGQFRIILLPHRDQSREDFQQQLEERLNLFSPFPDKPFLERMDQSDLVNYVDAAFKDGAHKDNAFRPQVESDLKLYLATGSWPSTAWPSINDIIKTKMQAAIVSSEEQ